MTNGVEESCKWKDGRKVDGGRKVSDARKKGVAYGYALDSARISGATEVVKPARSQLPRRRRVCRRPGIRRDKRVQ